MFHIQPGWFWERRRLGRDRGEAAAGAQPELGAPGGRASRSSSSCYACRRPDADRLERRARRALPRHAAGRGSRRHLAARRDRRGVCGAGGQGLSRADARRAARADLRPAGARRPAAAGPGLVGEDGARAAVEADHARARCVLADAEPRLCRPDRRGVPASSRGIRAPLPVPAPQASSDWPAAARCGAHWPGSTSAGCSPASGSRPASAATRIASRGPRPQRWRAAYLEARAESGVAGFAFFDFRFENSPPGVVRELLRELTRLL